MEPRSPKQLKKKKPVSEPVGGWVKSRTRAEELAVIKAMMDTLENLDEGDYHEILVNTLKRHPWIGVYLRACFDPNRKYGLKSFHLKKLKKPSKATGGPLGFFVVLTKLQFGKFTPIEGATEWWRVVQDLPRDLRRVANMILNKKMGELDRKMCNKAMKEAGVFPLIPKKESRDE